MKLRSLSVLLLVALPMSCGTTIDDISSSQVSSTVPVVEEDGVVTATFPADREGIAVASASSETKESFVTVPAGTLAVETEIKLGEADDQADALLQSVGISKTENAVAYKTAPLFAGPETNTALKTGTIAISLPLPLDKKDELELTTAEGKLVFIYLVYTKTGYIAGVKALTTANLVGTFSRVDMKGFGYFQLAFLAKAVEDKEIEHTGDVPALKN